MSKLEELNQRRSYLLAKKELTEESLIKLQKRIQDGQEETYILTEVNNYFTSEIQSKISEVKEKIEKIINTGLQYVFNDGLSIEIESTVKNNKTVFYLKVKHRSIESSKITESFGGGVYSTISFLFKVIVNILIKNKRFQVFDESLMMVSEQYQEPLSAFIRKLCEELNATIVLVTHQPLISQNAHVVFEAYSDNSSTKFKEIIHAKPE